jgi:hypothetical protein
VSWYSKIARSFAKRNNLRFAKRALVLQRQPLSFYCDLLKKNTPFSFARYGDGEWAAILGRKGANCDGHQYYPDLGRRLSSALKGGAPYFYGLQDYTLKVDGREIVDYLRSRAIDIPFHNADVFAFANVLGRLGAFVEALRKKPVAIIGPSPLRGLARVVPLTEFFEIPSTNCFLQADEVIARIREWGTKRAGVVYLFSASMAANVMIHELFPLLGATNWLIDVGSIWDPYVGLRSRSWFQSLDLEPAMRRNLGQNPSGLAQTIRDRAILFVNRFRVKT